MASLAVPRSPGDYTYNVPRCPRGSLGGGFGCIMLNE
jgi:hypothetical protein